MADEKDQGNMTRSVEQEMISRLKMNTSEEIGKASSSFTKIDTKAPGCTDEILTTSV